MARAGAVEVEAMANIRLAEEYDAAQGRGEVAGPRDGDRRSQPERLSTSSDLGLNRREIHDARRHCQRKNIYLPKRKFGI